MKRLLANGTTTATYFGSLHLEPNKILVDTIIKLGQRAVVGKVGAHTGGVQETTATLMAMHWHLSLHS